MLGQVAKRITSGIRGKSGLYIDRAGFCVVAPQPARRRLTELSFRPYDQGMAKRIVAPDPALLKRAAEAADACEAPETPPDDPTLAGLTPPQRLLARRLSELCEQAWCCGWHPHWEYMAWNTVTTGGGTNYRETLSRQTIEELRWLTDAAGGWIVDEPHRSRFVPLPEWELLFAAWKATPAGRQTEE
jgi:hypothetical protein